MTPHAGYRRAEQMIRGARRTAAAVLRLDNSRLDEVPESLAELTQLRTLHLSWNDLESLPEWLGQLTQLRELELNYNKSAHAAEVA